MTKTTEELIAEKPKDLKDAEKAISNATKPQNVVSDEVKAQYEVLEITDPIPEVPELITKPVEEIDMANPKEGDSFIDERGDTHLFQNGTWIIIVANSAFTF